MEPTLKEGEKIIASGILYLFKRPKINDIVVFKFENIFLIKRVINIKNGKYFLRGDNIKDSLDSKVFGEVKKEKIIAKYICKI